MIFKKEIFKKVFVFFFVFVFIFFPFVKTFAGEVAPTIPQNNGSSLAGFLFDISTNTLGRIVGFIFYLIFQLISVFFAITSYILDYVIDLTVVQMSENIRKMVGIETAWRLIRDLINLSFIFILIYNGILKIFGKSKDIVSTITKIITAAILINFSLFFTRIIIDASNILTVEFYKAIVSDGGSFSATLTSKLKLSGFWDAVTAPSSDNVGQKLFVVYVAGSIFTLIATFVLLAISVLFIIRYIAYIFLLIISPLGVASGLIPNLDSYGKKYWDTLKNQSIWPPVYMLMTWITLTLISDPSFSAVTTKNFSTALSYPDGVSTPGLIINYAIVIGLLINSLTLAKETASKGGFVTSNILSTATGFLGGAVLGSSAWLGRTTLGRVGNAVSASEKVKGWAQSDNRFVRSLGQQTLKRSEQASKSEFDVRNTRAFGQVNSQLGVNFGKPGMPLRKDAGKGGYAGVLERKIEEGTLFRKGIKEEEALAKKLGYSKDEIDAAKKELRDPASLAKERAFKIAEINKQKSDPNSEYNKRKADMDRAYIAASGERAAHLSAQTNRKFAETSVTSTRNEVSKKQKEKKKATNPADKARIQSEIDSLLNTTLPALMLGLETAKEQEGEAKIKYEEAMIPYTRIKAEQDAYESRIMSPEKAELIKITGGQEEEKDKFDNVIKSGVLSVGGDYLAKRADEAHSGVSETIESSKKLKGLFTKNTERANRLRKASKKTK